MYVIYSGHISQLKHVCDIFWTYMTRIYLIHVLVDLYDQNISHACFS
jgi:hypothetical protein